MKKLLTLTVAGLMAAGPAMAELVFPSLSYRTGPYAAGGIPFADGYADYFTLLNERDGGIGGVMTRVPECETAYNTERGVECYEATRGEGALVYQPLSTGITYQLIPRVTADEIPLHTMGYGRTSAANGEVFEWVFNYPANYWDGASVIINYLLEQNEGSLEGQKIALLYHNSAYGREPIRTLEILAEEHGFELVQLAVDHPGQEQGNQWLTIRRERPDYVVMWGWGVMNQVAVQEGADADGYLSLNMNVLGDLPVFDEIQQYVHDAGLAAGDGSNLGSVLYTRGMYAAMLAAEAARTAQEIHGVDQIDASMMRDGMEALEITEERMEELGMPGVGPAFEVTCANHGGPGMGRIQQWNAADQEWVTLTDFIAPDDSVTQPLIEEDSMAFAEESGIEPRDCAM